MPNPEKGPIHGLRLIFEKVYLQSSETQVVSIRNILIANDFLTPTKLFSANLLINQIGEYKPDENNKLFKSDYESLFSEFYEMPIISLTDTKYGARISEINHSIVPKYFRGVLQGTQI